MKIIYFTNQFFLHGGIEKIMAEKLNYLQSILGHETILCTSDHQTNPFVYPLNNGIKHVDLKINYHKNLSYFHPKNLLKSLIHLIKLRRFIQAEQPDVIVSVNTSPEQYLLALICKHIPKIKEFHSSGITFNKPKNLLDQFKKRLFLLFRKYDALVVLNKEELIYYPFHNVYVIPNFVKVPKKVPTANREKVILAAGRIATVKQFDHLIKAWSLIAKNHSDWQLRIFGDGDEVLTNQLQSLIDHLKVPAIHLMGATNQLTKEMQHASIFAMTSSTECFPMVLLEAQSAGLPIVSYDCPHGPGQIVTHNKNGLLIPKNEIFEFAKALSRLIEDESLRNTMGWSAFEQVQNYSKQHIMQHWNSLFYALKTYN